MFACARLLALIRFTVLGASPPLTTLGEEPPRGGISTFGDVVIRLCYVITVFSSPSRPGLHRIFHFADCLFTWCVVERG